MYDFLLIVRNKWTKELFLGPIALFTTQDAVIRVDQAESNLRVDLI